MESPFPGFLAAMPPVTSGVDAVVRPSEASIARWAHLVPPELVAFWRAIGWGGFGNGIVHICDPALLQPSLELWLGTTSDLRVPFSRSAFGEIFYWRDMRSEAAQAGMTGTRPGELGDVSCVDPHVREISVLAVSVDELFEDAFCDAGFAERFLRRSLVDAAREIWGPLAPHEQLAFVPALALGGAEDLGSVAKVDMFVQQSLLRQT